MTTTITQEELLRVFAKYAPTEISGLKHLEGKEVKVRFKVKSGRVSLEVNAS